MKPLDLYVYWSCIECGLLLTTKASLPGICPRCGTNCWRSPPETRNETDDNEPSE